MKLPLWRLVAAILVLLTMAVVLVSIAPVYIENFQLRQYIRTLTRGEGSAAVTDEALRAAVLMRAKQLDLPVAAEDVRITRQGGKPHVDLRYAVQIDFPLYQVDLHP
jgi:hypothetical protein